jgi:hypothetical protein
MKDQKARKRKKKRLSLPPKVVEKWWVKWSGWRRVQFMIQFASNSSLGFWSLDPCLVLWWCLICNRRCNLFLSFISSHHTQLLHGIIFQLDENLLTCMYLSSQAKDKRVRWQPSGNKRPALSQAEHEDAPPGPLLIVENEPAIS